MRRYLAACFIVLLSCRADAAYLGSSPLLVTPSNVAGQLVGSSIPGTATIPLIDQQAPPFAVFPTPPAIIGKGALFTDIVGRPTVAITDGARVASISPPFAGAVAGQAALAVSISPNPTFQCPLTAPVNQTASTTVVTNTGGKAIHVCSVVLISATQQGLTLAEGTGTTCATGPTYWLGGSGGTAQVAANGGFSVSGNWVNLPMQVRGDNVCVLQSASGNVSGYLTYGIY